MKGAKIIPNTMLACSKTSQSAAARLISLPADTPRTERLDTLRVFSYINFSQTPFIAVPTFTLWKKACANASEGTIRRKKISAK